MRRMSLALGLTIPTRGMSVGGATPVTWNPDDKGSIIVLSNGDLSMDTSAAGNWNGARATVGKTTGKWAFEITTRSTFQIFIGVGTSQSAVGPASTDFVGHDAYGYGYYGANGQLYYNGSGSAYGSAYVAGSVITVIFDADARTLQFKLNGTLQGSPIDISALSGALYPIASIYANGLDANFGPTLLYPETGYDALQS